MVFSYYPGCTLKNKAKELDIKARLCAEKMGFTLDELTEWQCCGGAYSSNKNEIGNKLPAVRALLQSAERGTDLVTLCSACHNVIKRTCNDIMTDNEFADKAERYLQTDLSAVRQGKVKVLHYLEVIRDIVGYDNLKNLVSNPLNDRKIAAYYGCLLLRPGKVMAMDDPENPKIIEELIKALGGEAVIYPYRSECCGGYISFEDKNQALKQSRAIIESAAGFGADSIVTACPLCLYNLNKSGSEIPVMYFTEILAQALGV